MGKRRSFTAEFKVQRVLAVISGRQSAAEVCREYQLHPQVLGRWKSEFQENAVQIFETDRQRDAEQERIAELERLVGRQALELEILKKVTGNSR